MQKATLVVRILMGAMLIVFGLNKFLQFISMPPPAPEMGAILLPRTDAKGSYDFIPFLNNLAIMFKVNKAMEK